MALVGQYPVVKGDDTLARFFEIVSDRPVPEPPSSWKAWLQKQGLKSSYFGDTIPFARFAGLIDNDGPTELWDDLRDATKFGPALTGALQTAYQAPLKELGIETPTRNDSAAISNWIKVSAKSSATDAELAAATLMNAFDVALGRQSESDTPKQTRVSPNARSTGTQKAVPKPSQSKSDAGSKSDIRNTLGVRATLAVNLQIVLPADASDDRYDAILGSVAKHLTVLLSDAQSG